MRDDRRNGRWGWAIALLLAAPLGGCAADSSRCTTGAECASGACQADGRCVPVDGVDASPYGSGVDVVIGTDAADGSSGEVALGPDGAVADVVETADGTPDTGAVSQDTGPDEDIAPPPGVCVPNKDGLVTRDEMPIAAGLHATYKVALDVDYDTEGKPGDGNARVWDLSGALPGDVSVLVEARPLEDTWFGDTFPGATYAARLSETEDLLGVFEATDDALLLRGVASIEDGLMKTELEYDPPVEVLAFPIERDATWSTKSTVTGLAKGVFVTYFEDYTSTVDAEGTLKAPFSDFPVLRVNVELVRTIGFVPTTVRTHMYVTECFGTVGTVISKDYETESEFQEASEVRRLAP